MKLAGLDFERANRKNGSICAAGCALLTDGVVTEGREWLIHPHRGYRWMLREFTEIHGLNYWDVKDSPEFPEVRSCGRCCLQPLCDHPLRPF